MGVSMDDINKGVLDAGKLIASSMQAWNAIAGKPSLSTGGIVAEAPAGGGVSAQPQGKAATPAAGGLAGIPALVWLVGLGVLAWRYW